MILEGVVTTRSTEGAVNVAPMGPVVSEDEANWKKLVLKPFQTSRTFQNLRATGEGVFHVVDDVLLLARATIGTSEPTLAASSVVSTPRLADCCRYFEFRVERIDENEARSEIAVKVVHEGRVRDFFGLNRAKHAVVEAAILASRVGLLGKPTILAGMASLKPLVDKTGGAAEREAFALLDRYVSSHEGERTAENG